MAMRKPIPKRALPNKPLPSKPLPSKPLPSQQQPPPQQQQQQQQQIPNNTQYTQPEEKSSQPEPQPEPQQQPEPQPEPSVPQQQTQESDEKQGQTETEPETSNNWYKPRIQNKKSYQSAKTCKLLLDDKKNKMKKVKLFATYDKFFVAEGNSKNRGFQVASICNNEYGKAFEKMNISPGWRVTKVSNKPLQNISFAMLKNQLISIGQKLGTKGYYLMFDGNPEKEQKEEDIPKMSAQSVSVSADKCSVELISSYNDHKVVKMNKNIDKYIDFASVKGPKGYKISGFKQFFGNDLKQYGIDVDWRVIKIGDKDVSNKFTQGIRSDLDKEWKNNGNNGIKVTFGQPV